MGYRAFFSCARADDRIANWLPRQLDTYCAPKALVGVEGVLGPVPTKLHPIFRDRTDLQAGGHVDGALQQALEESETLIVLCTPTSAKSHWVNHECETFLRLGRRLTQQMETLVRSACEINLIANEHKFTPLEIAADPLIREVWLCDSGTDQDV